MKKYMLVACILGGIVFVICNGISTASKNHEKLLLTSPIHLPSPASEIEKARPTAHNAVSTSSPSLLPDSARPKNEEAKRLLGVYQMLFKGNSNQGRLLLDSVYALGLDPNNENYQQIQRILKSSISNEERVALARILGNFYSKEDTLGVNSEILANLKDLVNLGNKEVGHAAALGYSSLGYFPDSQKILSYAKENGYIDDSEYFGELSYLISEAPPKMQSAIVDQIRSGANEHSLQVLASILLRPENLKPFSPEAINALKVLFLEREPNFSEAPDKFGLFDAFKYSDWLQSLALLNSVDNASHYDQYVMKVLNSKKTDPRKLMAFLMSSDGEQLMGRVGPALSGVQNRIEEYAADNTKNLTTQEVFNLIKGNMKTAIH